MIVAEADGLASDDGGTRTGSQRQSMLMRLV